MVQHSGAVLDASFAALSDATRRGVLEQLGRADASIAALAVKFHMTLTGMKKHVGVLEQAGLVSTEKVGRVRTCKLGLRGLEQEAAFRESFRSVATHLTAPHSRASVRLTPGWSPFRQLTAARFTSVITQNRPYIIT